MLETHEPAYLLEEKIVRLDGAVRDVEIAGAAVTYQGEPAIQLVGRDVTERRRAEAARRRLEERVREGRRRESLLRLAEGVANELQVLLRELNGSVDECVAEQKPMAGRRLAALRKVGRRMHELTEQLQNFVGKRRAADTRVSLSELVLELSERLDAEVGAAHLGFDLPVGLPRVRADVNHLRRIVSALVRNSVDALGPKGGNVTVRTLAIEADAALLAEFEPSESLAPGLYAGVEVRDTGCGMDEATRAQVLEPFFSTKSPGRGLALAEVLGLVGTCGGGIRVVSAPGRGTTVTVLFPASPERLEGRKPRRV
jgi:signal transduction histidine kinase